MKIEEKLEKMKKIYLSTPVPDYEVIKEWQVLENVLGEQQKSYPSPFLFRTGAFLAVILILSGGVVTIAQASKPGEFLYPVKEISQKVVKEVKKSSSVFMNSKPVQSDENEETPTVTPQRDDEDEKVKGSTDKRKGNTYEEKGEDKKSNDVGRQSSNKKEQNVEVGNNENNNSGSDNNGQRNESESEGKSDSASSSQDEKEQVSNNQEKSNGNSHSNSSKK